MKKLYYVFCSDGYNKSFKEKEEAEQFVQQAPSADTPRVIYGIELPIVKKIIKVEEE